ncbi:MAG: Bcr/CflA family drug resistance efflux transporter, partial [Bradyrhizobium sp.]|nr:Bcr/CflA family drug resistance efflux transporter [Bradyrhizobium sp.]
SQLGAYLGGHYATTLPLTSAILALSLACACSMIFLVPRTAVTVTKELIEAAEEDETGVM